jgi:uncharacterized hydrophobic protein (TIGR00271 family)
MKNLIGVIRSVRDKHAGSIDREGVVKGIYLDSEISGGYFVSLVVAGLIALCGLLTNSSPVIIGAMLISPLMGPMLSFGYAFITGEKSIFWKASRKIAISVAVTIVAAAAATAVSPFSDLTSEIATRTHPNLFDLIIAFLAGAVGASAICTRKNYLTVIPGVAIATAVIPPLSVSGFGAGIASLPVFFGGFLLFFTNFVAIIISSCAVFLYYGLRPVKSTGEGDELRKRSWFLGLVLVIVSIPLAYTLHSSVSEVRLRKEIQGALKEEFNRDTRSSLVSFTYRQMGADSLEISAMVNTVDYLKEAEVRRVETETSRKLGRKVTLGLEQVKVQPGGLKDPVVQLPLRALQPVKPPAAPSLADSQDRVLDPVRKASVTIERMAAPCKVKDFTAGFSSGDNTVHVKMTISRDVPFSESERDWIRRLLASDLGMPVTLSLETVPVVGTLKFDGDATELSPEMKSRLLAIRELGAQATGLSILLEESKGGRGHRFLGEARARSIRDFLAKECGVRESGVRESFSRKSPEGEVVVSVLPIASRD